MSDLDYDPLMKRIHAVLLLFPAAETALDTLDALEVLRHIKLARDLRRRFFRCRGRHGRKAHWGRGRSLVSPPLSPATNHLRPNPGRLSLCSFRPRGDILLTALAHHRR